MGLLRRLGELATTRPTAPSGGLERTRQDPGAGAYWTGDPLVQLTGTTTFCKDAVAALVARHHLPERGCLETLGTVQREPDNTADPNAIAVHVEGERVGYLPGWIAAEVTLPAGGSVPVPVQVFTAPQDGHVRALAWAWLADGRPTWAHSAQSPPPVTREERRAAEHTGRQALVADAMAQGGERAEHFAAGMVDGVHYLELVEPIKALKREGRLEEALVLCYAAITGAENSRAGGAPAPFYTEQAAIVARKLGRREEEIAVLRRYLAHLPPAHRATHPFTARLAKLESP